MATGYLSVLLQPLGALRTVFGVPTAARCALVRCARNRKSFRHMVTGFNPSKTYINY